MASVAFVVLYVGAVIWEAGQRMDAWLFGAAQQLNALGSDGALPWLARTALPVFLVLVLVACSVHAHGYRGWRPLVKAGAVITISVLLSRVLRDLVLWRPIHDGTYAYVHNTFPSTHVTFVAAALVAVWWLAPRRSWWLGLLLVLVLGFTALGNVTGHAHRPSDAIGSILLVAAVASVIGGRW